MAEIRPATWDDFDEYFTAMGGPFGFTLQPEGTERDELRERVRSYSPFERGRVAEDAGRIVGTLGVFALDMTVPGGSMQCAGTTWVTVSATHRRQGLLRALMASHLDEARQNGDPIAALWASESSIYGRFGFGVAADELTLKIDRNFVAFRDDAPTPAETRFIDLGEAATVLPAAYETMRRELPGSFGRTEAWWKNRRLRDDPDHRDGMSDLRVLVARSPDGDIDGYAMFRIKPNWEGHHADHTVHVVELLGTTPASWSGLWHATLGHDLATTVEAGSRATDEPLLDMLAAPRRAEQTVSDNVWVRVLDVEAALTGRTYAGPGTVTFALDDRMGLTGGTWRLETDGESSTCSPTDADPELAFDVEVLGAALLGRPRFAALRRAGRVHGDHRAAVATDRLFRHDRAPACPEVF